MLTLFKIYLYRGLLEVLQLDFIPKDISEHAESQTLSWRLELPGNVKDVGVMRIFTAKRDFVGLAPLVMVSIVHLSIKRFHEASSSSL